MPLFNAESYCGVSNFTVQLGHEQRMLANWMLSRDRNNDSVNIEDRVSIGEAIPEDPYNVDMVTVEATEEVAPVADVEMTVQTNSIERPVENDLAMLTIDHLRKSSHVDINDAMTMTTKVNI